MYSFLDEVRVDATCRQEVWDWCEDNDILVEYQGTIVKIDIWHIRDEVQRAWFMLRWN